MNENEPELQIDEELSLPLHEEQKDPNGSMSDANPVDIVVGSEAGAEW